MTFFPLFCDLKEKEVLICGGGSFALHRVKKLLPFSPHITVISAQISEEIKAFSSVTCIERAAEEADFDAYPFLVVLAEEEEEVVRLLKFCKDRHLPVNAVDLPQYCDVIFPSVLTTENLCIGVSSGGLSPTATVELRDRISALLPPHVDDIVAWMPFVRDLFKTRVEKQKHSRLLREIFVRALEKDAPLTEEEVEAFLQEEK